MGSAVERALRIRYLTILPDLRGSTALCRLVRFEPSELLSDYAALEIMYEEPFDRASRAGSGGCSRRTLPTAAVRGPNGFSASCGLAKTPRRRLPEWRRLVEAEYSRWQQAPDKANPEIAVGLLYLLAQAYAERGDRAAADKTAQQAQQVPRPSDLLGLILRMQTAWMLGRRGSPAWAETEYRFLMSCGQATVIVDSGRPFAEYLHDQGKPLAAAEVYQKTLDAMDVRRFDADREGDSAVNARGRMNYFRACHWLEEKDPVKQLYFLERALQADPGEIDSLIACYRLPNATPPFRERIVKSIQRETAQLRGEMAKDPKSPSPCNQFAWLVCNTQGDLDEALRASQKSLELSPNTSAYLDTLAHVYFAKGDVANAVKYQTLAMEREPHSGLLTGELKRFRAAFEAKTKTVPEKPETKPAAAKNQNK